MLSKFSFINFCSDHDDLLFEINDGDYADGTLNEDELLLSDEGEDNLFNYLERRD